jgi:hypothetical protein
MSREYFPIWKIHFLIKILSERDEEGNIQMYLQDLITCNKIIIIQKLEVLFIINIL